MKGKKLAIVVMALLALAPAGAGLEGVGNSSSTVLAATKSKKHKKKTSKKKSKKLLKNMKLPAPYEGQSTYEFKSWRSLGLNDAGITVAYGFVREKGKKTPSVQFAFYNFKKGEIEVISDPYSVKKFLKKYKHDYFVITSDLTYHITKRQLNTLRKIIKKAM